MQVAATAVMMTDFVYWLILVPYVLPKTFKHTFVRSLSSAFYFNFTTQYL